MANGGIETRVGSDGRFGGSFRVSRPSDSRQRGREVCPADLRIASTIEVEDEEELDCGVVVVVGSKTGAR